MSPSYLSRGSSLTKFCCHLDVSFIVRKFDLDTDLNRVKELTIFPCLFDAILSYSRPETNQLDMICYGSNN